MKEIEEFEKHGRAFVAGLVSILDLVNYAKDLGRTREELKQNYDNMIEEEETKLKQRRKLIEDSEERILELRTELDNVQSSINSANQQRQAIEEFISKRKHEIEAELGVHRKKVEDDLKEYKKEAKEKKAKAQREAE